MVYHLCCCLTETVPLHKARKSYEREMQKNYAFTAQIGRKAPMTAGRGVATKLSNIQKYFLRKQAGAQLQAWQ